MCPTLMLWVMGIFVDVRSGYETNNPCFGSITKVKLSNAAETRIIRLISGWALTKVKLSAGN